MEMLNQLHGVFLGDNLSLAILGAVFVFLFLGYLGVPLVLWSAVILVAGLGFGLSYTVLGAVAGVLVLLNVTPIRKILLTTPIMKVMQGIFPKISDTERTALEAGVVWTEADLFSGKPNIDNLMNQKYPKLTEEEQAFIDGPVNELCAMVNDWDFWKRKEMPPEAMQFIKDKGFLGMIIPKEYGGLGFSNYAHSEVIMKLSTRSISVGITVMVPNSLGPGELLTHFGTDEQKKRYLPKLAKGDDLPCFGLTEPQAGSDAGAIQSEGVLFKGDDGKIYVRLNWRKRWITLAAISTLIGLAFRLRDPENLLGKGEDLGITCALIPSNLEGVVIGDRHDPLGVPFYNCPTEGRDVVINAEEQIIGGMDGAGKGWQMLMDSLGAGRGISLPAQSAGGIKLSARAGSAHGTIRKQFGVSVGKFEGVEEPLARIAGYAYMVESMRLYTLSALDQGIKPPVVTAMAKYNATEMGRKTANDLMDVMGGAAISMGPRNVAAVPYIAAPIGITVEGANILTRTLMIFGQGALRAHPYAYAEVKAAESGDVSAFDKAFWGHMGHVFRNKIRAFVLGATKGYVAGRGYGGPMGRYFQKLSWASAKFAFMADLAMALLGGKLKFKEKITGRFADILSYMYIATAVLKKFKEDGQPKEDLPFVRYSLDYCFAQIQEAFDGIYANFDVMPPISWIFKGPFRWFNGLFSFGSLPTDHTGHLAVKTMMTDGAARDRLTHGLYHPKDPEEQMLRLDRAFKKIKEAEGVDRKIRKAIRTKTLPKKRIPELIDMALEKGVITAEEKAVITEAEELRWDAIQVDDFTQEQYRQYGEAYQNQRPKKAPPRKIGGTQADPEQMEAEMADDAAVERAATSH
jgi:acyl-CoA dehydrogenase